VWPPGPDRITQAEHVCHVGIEIATLAARPSHATPIVHDHPRELGQPVEILEDGPVFADGFDVVELVERPEQVDRALADRPVGQLDTVSGSNAARFGQLPHVPTIRLTLKPDAAHGTARARVAMTDR
jgi:hypothetical protein